MHIQQRQQDNKGAFFIHEAGEDLALMTYTMSSPALMIIDHTEVSDVLRGKNIGYQLVHHAVEYARANGISILPLCPFAKAVFVKKAAEYADVLRK